MVGETGSFKQKVMKVAKGRTERADEDGIRQLTDET